MDKPWLKVTDWQCFVLNSLEPHQAAISGLRPFDRKACTGMVSATEQGLALHAVRQRELGNQSTY
jgi:hypothetical protein